MEKQIILNEFGELLIHFVRDRVVEDYTKTQEGKIKSKSGIELYSKLSTLDKKNLSIVKDVVLDTIDSTLDYFLWMIEQYEEYDLIRYTDDEKRYVSLREISDGLSGELHTEEGWIEKFSAYKLNLK